MWHLEILILGASIITAFVISYISMPVIIKVDNMKRLMDEPDHVRKFHNDIIPTLGGLGIFGAFLIAFSIWGRATHLNSYPFFVASLLMLFLIGLKDDILMISPVKKLMVQTMAALVVVYGGQVELTNLEGLFGIYQMNEIIGSGISILFMVTVINAFNLIDGIDGLAGGIGIICSTVLGLWFWNTEHVHLAVLAFVLVGALIGFLVYNFSPAKIFMGDTGSMIVGFIVAFLCLHFMEINRGLVNSEYYLSGAPAIVFSILIIPIFDTLRVFFFRLLKKKSPFQPDNNHIHHILLRSGYTHASASIALWTINVFIILVTLSIREVAINILIGIILFIAILILPTLQGIGNLYRNVIIENTKKGIRKKLYSDMGMGQTDSYKKVDRRKLNNSKIAEFEDN